MRPARPITGLKWPCPSPSCKSSTRTFVSSSSNLQQSKRPESPAYIDIPESIQPRAIPRKPLKGILPTPRDIFKERSRTGGVDKVTPQTIAASTPEPSTQTIPVNEAHAAIKEWRTKMATTRRQNLREGLLELQTRRRRQKAFLSDRSSRRKSDRQAVIDQPQRPDVALTEPSITELMKPYQVGDRLQDPNRAERIASMTARVKEKDLAKADARRQALHTLYMRAKDFIVTETQLDQAIESVFGTQERPTEFLNRGTSIWAEGPPPTLQEKLNKANLGRTSLEDQDARNRLLRDRLGKIAEELTGGKM